MTKPWNLQVNNKEFVSFCGILKYTSNVCGQKQISSKIFVDIFVT